MPTESDVPSPPGAVERAADGAPAAGPDGSTGGAPSRDRGRVIRLAPAVLAGATLLLGLPHLGTRQLWLDELATLDYATRPLPELWALVQQRDAVVAPYYLFMHGWLAVAGTSEIALRLPSLAAVAGAVALTVVIGRRWFGNPAGVLAGFLTTVAPATSRYATEARPYAMSLLFGLSATLLLLRATERPVWSRWSAYAGAVALTGSAHLVALSLIAAHPLVVADAWRRDRDRRQARWCVAAAGALLPVVPLVWLGNGQAAQVGWIPPATVGRLLTEVPGVVGDPRSGIVVVTLAMLGAVPLDRWCRVALVWAFAPPVLLYLAAPRVELLHQRYLLVTLPALVLLAAVAMASFLPTSDRRRAVGVAGAVAALCLSLAAPAYLDSRLATLPGEPDLRGAAALVAAGHRPGDRLAVHGRFPMRWRQALVYYLPARTEPPVVSVTAPPDTTAPGFGGDAPDVPRIWLVNTEGQAGPWDGMTGQLAGEISVRYEVTSTTRLAGATLSLLEPRNH